MEYEEHARRVYVNRLTEAMMHPQVGLVSRLEASELLQSEIKTVQADLVGRLRNQGLSWWKIGAIFNMTPQGAHNRWGTIRDEEDVTYNRPTWDEELALLDEEGGEK